MLKTKDANTVTELIEVIFMLTKSCEVLVDEVGYLNSRICKMQVKSGTSHKPVKLGQFYGDYCE